MTEIVELWSGRVDDKEVEPCCVVDMLCGCSSKPYYRLKQVNHDVAKENEWIPVQLHPFWISSSMRHQYLKQFPLTVAANLVKQVALSAVEQHDDALLGSLTRWLLQHHFISLECDVQVENPVLTLKLTDCSFQSKVTHFLRLTGPFRIIGAIQHMTAGLDKTKQHMGILNANLETFGMFEYTQQRHLELLRQLGISDPVPECKDIISVLLYSSTRVGFVVHVVVVSL